MTAGRGWPPDRRRFLEVVLGLGGAGALGVLAGCGPLASLPVPIEGGRVRLALRDHPSLLRPGGVLELRPEGQEGTVYVLAPDAPDPVRTSEGWVALSPVCTHLGCTVEVEGARLVCPCHGSTYDRTGTVVRGPAQRSLTRFRTTVRDGVLDIHLSREG